MMGQWFDLSGDARLGSCATEGCGGQPTKRLEAGGVGSNYCSGCAAKITALPAAALPDGLEERLRYRVENPSAWPEGFDQEASDLMRDAAGALAAMRVERDEALLCQKEIAAGSDRSAIVARIIIAKNEAEDRAEAAEQQVRDMRVGLRNALAAGLPEVVATSIRLLLKEGGE